MSIVTWLANVLHFLWEWKQTENQVTSINYLKLAVFRLRSTSALRKGKNTTVSACELSPRIHLKFKWERDKTKNVMYSSVFPCSRSRTGFLPAPVGLSTCKHSVLGTFKCPRFPDVHIVLKRKWWEGPSPKYSRVERTWPKSSLKIRVNSS